MLTIDTGGFLLAGMAIPAGQRPFPLEGQRDVFQALAQRAPVESGPVPPSLGQQLGPALKALRKTVKSLGPNPTPYEMDNSNLRRLVRATLSVVEAHRDSFSEKDHRRGTRELKKLASAVGRFKDAGILEATVRSQFDGGKLPDKLETAIGREKARRAEAFDEAWKHFRETGLERVKRSFSRPHGMETTPAGLRREDERRNRQHIARLLDELDRTGLQHECPDAFHEGRKALRAVLHACLASRESVQVSQEDLARMSNVVDGLGVAQDQHIAYTWLERKGFAAESAVARASYQKLHEAELQGVEDLLASGTLERVRKSTREGPQNDVFRPFNQVMSTDSTRTLVL